MGAAAEGGQAGAGAGTAGNGGAGTAGSAGSGGGEGGAPSDAGAAGALVEPAKNYEVTGTWPEQPVALATKPGTLKFTKLVLQQEFLAESCSIGDYDNDGVPDVSSGRIWYQGPDFTTAHPFRDGHGPLPRSGQRAESDTGVSDDVADYPVDVDVDGDTDIINCAQSDTDEVTFTGNKIGTVQPQATCYWYENPGPTGQAGDPNWTPHLMHDDVRLEQHGLLDMNGDGFPEIYGACRDCPLESAKGYYQVRSQHSCGDLALSRRRYAGGVSFRRPRQPARRGRRRPQRRRASRFARAKRCLAAASGRLVQRDPLHW